MILYCGHCHHIWEYQGDSDKETSCPKCKSYVPINKQRLDQDVSVNADIYSGAKYLGVTQAYEVIYWDSMYGPVVFQPETGLWREDPLEEESPLEYYLVIEENIGWLYHHPIYEIINF